MLFETMSKMPALLQVVDRACASKVFFSDGVCGSVEAALKSATARRMRSTPRLVPVFTQSCAGASLAAPSTKIDSSEKKAGMYRRLMRFVIMWDW